MNKHRKTIRDILIDMVGFQRGTWEAPKTSEICGELLVERQPISREKMEHITRELLKNGKMDFEEYFLYLPPIDVEPGLVPIISLLCDLTGSSEKIRIELQMYRHVRDGTERSKLKGFGFRFEGPHQGSQINEKHDYYHVQPITKTRSPKEELPDCPNWISDKIPCIPAGVDNSVCLILFMLVSLYGEIVLTRFLPTTKIPSEYKSSLMYLLKGTRGNRAS